MEMAKAIRSKSVPKGMQSTYDSIVALTDAFCREHLNEEYRELAQDMAAALCRKRSSPLSSGQPRTWACGIIHTLGQINFLSDRSTQPYMTMADVSSAFGVGQSTARASDEKSDPMSSTSQQSWNHAEAVGRASS
jgi:hypothetical protein